MLAPMFFLAQMPTVVSQQLNDRILCMFTLFESVEYPSYLSIGKADGCEVGLNRFAPLVVFDYVLVIPSWCCKVSFS